VLTYPASEALLRATDSDPPLSFANRSSGPDGWILGGPATKSVLARAHAAGLDICRRDSAKARWRLFGLSTTAARYRWKARGTRFVCPRRCSACPHNRSRRNSAPMWRCPALPALNPKQPFPERSVVDQHYCGGPACPGAESFHTILRNRAWASFVWRGNRVVRPRLGGPRIQERKVAHEES
jgi:hypothetical protein